MDYKKSEHFRVWQPKLPLSLKYQYLFLNETDYDKTLSFFFEQFVSAFLYFVAQ